MDDSFFDLGGDSLTAMRVMAAINSGLDSELVVRTLFDAPTVAQLASRIGEEAGRRQPLIVAAAGSGAVVVCSESVVVPQPVRGRGGDLQHADRVPDHGDLDVEVLDAALDDVIARHESLRTVFADWRGWPFSRCWRPTGDVAARWRAVVALAESEMVGGVGGVGGASV